MEIQVDGIEESIKVKYLEYKELSFKMNSLIQEIAQLEEKRNQVIEQDERRFLFRKPAIDLRNFFRYTKEEKWITTEYEGFDDKKRPDIVDEAMIVDVYCYQSSYAAPVRLFFNLWGYLAADEYEILRKKYNGLPEYYVKGEKE